MSTPFYILFKVENYGYGWDKKNYIYEKDTKEVLMPFKK